jgi:hypothetical protein
MWPPQATLSARHVRWFAVLPRQLEHTAAQDGPRPVWRQDAGQLGDRVIRPWRSLSPQAHTAGRRAELAPHPVCRRNSGQVHVFSARAGEERRGFAASDWSNAGPRAASWHNAGQADGRGAQAARQGACAPAWLWPQLFHAHHSGAPVCGTEMVAGYVSSSSLQQVRLEAQVFLLACSRASSN